MTSEDDDGAEWPRWDDQSPEDRSAALASVLRSLGNQRGRDRIQISALIDAELRARRTRGLSAEERRFLVDASRSNPAIAGLRMLGRQAAGFARFARQNAVPRWTEPPKGITSLISWRDDQSEIPVVLALDACSPDDLLIERLLNELPGDRFATANDEGRPCEVWLHAAEGTDGPISVNIGTHAVAALPTPHQQTARALISQPGGKRKALAVHGELRGASRADATLTVYLLDPP